MCEVIVKRELSSYRSKYGDAGHDIGGYESLVAEFSIVFSTFEKSVCLIY